MLIIAGTIKVIMFDEIDYVIGAFSLLVNWRFWLLLFIGCFAVWFFFKVSYPAIVSAGYRAAQKQVEEDNKFNHKTFMDEEKKVGLEINTNRTFDAFRTDDELRKHDR
jgi:hypothetical protein